LCGIVGFYSEEKNKEAIIKKMADRIKHRGPDGDGYYTDEKVALGQRRLSIIDIERWQATNVYRR
jgi:asparagine synthase (glutamine-hydrolysing)